MAISRSHDANQHGTRNGGVLNLVVRKHVSWCNYRATAGGIWAVPLIGRENSEERGNPKQAEAAPAAANEIWCKTEQAIARVAQKDEPGMRTI